MQTKITPNLWFDTEAQEAADFYTSVFENSRIVNGTHYTESGPRETGMVMTVEEGPCGWVKDRYGLSWQVVPTGMDELFADPDAARADRAMRAMLGMRKLDIAALRDAAQGVAAA